MDARPEEQPTREELAERIKEVSAEGRPAAPRLKGRTIGVLLIVFGLAFVAVGIVLGFTVNWPTGFVAAVVGLALFFLSPMFWASVLRAREREQARTELGGRR